MVGRHPVAFVVAVGVLALTLGLASAWLLSSREQRATLAAGGLPPGAARPAFTLPDAQGHLRPVSEWDGKVLLVNFWATWCPPCRREIPHFIDLQARYGDRGLQIVGIAIDDPETVGALATSTGVNYPILLGEAGAIDASVRFGNAQGALPYTVVIDRSGRVVLTHLGEITPQVLDTLVQPLL